MSDHPNSDEVKAAIAYFRSTSNRHDLCDLLDAATGNAPPPDKAVDKVDDAPDTPYTPDTPNRSPLRRNK